MLAFFPWLETKGLKIERYALLSYERGTTAELFVLKKGLSLTCRFYLIFKFA
jgi:hypothetical protein